MKRRDFIRNTVTGMTLAAAGAARSVAANPGGDSEPKALELAGTKTHMPTSYRRLFPDLIDQPILPPQDIEDGLVQLGDCMHDPDDPVSCENEELPAAGYTYLGQFIDHDLTFDLTPLMAAGDVDLAAIQNFRSPCLDLDHVYGGGPNLSPFLYQRGNRGAERFLLGKTRPAPGSDNDLPRNSQGTALVGDPRQDENLILAQLHLAFLKMHNCIVGQPTLLNAPELNRKKGESDFSVAQRLLRWHYQWIVRYEYLPQILHPNVTALLCEKFEKPKRAQPQTDFRIPVEFSAAAFRFGHSMVRDVYKTGVNSKHGVSVNLTDLLRQTGLVGGAIPCLPEEWVVCWNRFFNSVGPYGTAINRSRRFDTKIANGLHSLKEQINGSGTSPIRPFSARLADEPLEPRLPVRTLLRGFRMKLPSGEAVAARMALEKPDLGIVVMPESQIMDGPHHPILADPKYGFRGNTPLWYYILKEAEVTEVEVDRHGTKRKGTCLGLLGSCLVADVIISALACDPQSYFSSPAWRPTLFPPHGYKSKIAKLLEMAFPEQKKYDYVRCQPAVLDSCPVSAEAISFRELDSDCQYR
jgi:hypothetical protein